MKVYAVCEERYRNNELTRKEITKIYRSLDAAKKHVVEVYSNKNYCPLVELDRSSGDWGRICAWYELFFKPGKYTEIIIDEYELEES